MTDYTLPLVFLSLSLPVGIAGWFFMKVDERRQRDLNYREELRTMRFKPSFQGEGPPQEEGGIVEKLINQALQNPQLVAALVDKFTKKGD